MRQHADFETLVAYLLGELGPDHEAALESHYMECEACSARLTEVDALAAGIRKAFTDGHVDAFLTPTFADQLRSRGVRLREYRVPRNGSVNCSVGPDDQLLLSRLQVPLEGVGRVDAIVEYEGEHRLEDIPFDAASGEVVLAPSMRRVRAMPAHSEVVRLVAVEAGGERLLGEYTFHHSPHR